MSNDSDAKTEKISSEENKFIFSFITMILKKGGERTYSDVISELR